MKSKYEMMKPYLALLCTTLIISTLQADCSNMPIGTNLAKSIMSEDLDGAKKYLTTYIGDIEAYLDHCKGEGERQQAKIMKLTYKEEVVQLEARLKKQHKVTFNCSTLPDTNALETAFESGDTTQIKKRYDTYQQNASDYLNHCATHPEFESVFEASLLYEEKVGSLYYRTH